MPAEPTKAETAQTFEAFLAKVPDAPSSAHAAPSEEAPAGDADAPLASTRDEKGKFSKRAAAQPESSSTAPSPESPPSAKTPTTGDPQPTATVEQVRTALAAGDLDSLADLLDEDPALYDEKTTKWAAQKRREAKLRAERDSTLAKAEAVVTRWSPVSQLVEATHTDPAQLFGLVELLTGKSADQAWTDAIRARGAHDPRVPVLQTRLAEREAELTTAQSARAEAADRAFYETLRDEVAEDSVVRKLDGWEARVAETLRESVDPDLGEPKLSVAQAVARVLRREREEFDRRAKLFGVETTVPPRAERKRSPERASGASGAKVRKLTRDEWLAARSNG